MTQEQEKAIRERLAKATTGPWHADNVNRTRSLDGPEIWACGMLVAKVAGLAKFDFENCELIAHAPEDIRSLLAEVDRLRNALREIRDNEFTGPTAKAIAILELPWLSDTAR